MIEAMYTAILVVVVSMMLDFIEVPSTGVKKKSRPEGPKGGRKHSVTPQGTPHVVERTKLRRLFPSRLVSSGM